jgi:phosphoribosyl 1,2-cyclic phosphodiesterase
VEVRTRRGTLIVVDCGTGAHELGLALMREGPDGRTGNVLITHTHWDHIQGLPFFAPFFDEKETWRVYGPRGLNASLRDVLSGQMEYAYFPVSLDGFAADISYHEVVEGEFFIDDVRIVTRFLNHPALTVGYRIEADGASFVYASDHEPHAREAALGAGGEWCGGDAEHLDFIRGADLLIHDCQYTAAEYDEKAGWGHSTVEYVVDAAAKADVRHVLLYHHDPTRTDDAVDGMLKLAGERARKRATSLRITAAREGDSFDIAPVAKTATAAEPRSALVQLGIPDDAAIVLWGVNADERAVLDAAAGAENIASETAGDMNEVAAFARRQRASIVFLGDAEGEAVAGARELRAAGVDAPIIFIADRPPPAESPAIEGADWLFRPFTLQYARTRMKAWMLRAVCRWRNAPLPADEAQRLEILRQLCLLDTPAEERFDRHTRIAASALDTPMAAVTLVDRDRQWFKSRRGFDAPETPRDQAICSHAVYHQEPVIVPDTLHDPRFADSPLVVGEPHVRFYAGIPLKVGDGAPVGTLCVMDYRPRDLSAEQVQVLTDIARLVEKELTAASVLAAEDKS